MRILIITPHLILRKGPYVWVREMVRKLSEKGIESHVLVFNEDVSEKNVIPYRKVHKLEKFFFKYPIFSLGKKIRTLDVENQYDIIHAIDPLICGFNAVRIGKETRTPSVITLHSEYFTEIQTWSSEQVIRIFSRSIPPFAKIGTYILSKIGIYSMDNTDKLVVPNNYLKKYLESYSLKSSVIPNGVNIDSYNQNTSQNDDETTVLSISHMKVPKKVEGLKILIDAMQIVRRDLPDTKLRVVGDGIYLPMLKEYSIKKRVDVDFLGFREDIPQLLKNCTIYVHSSLQDIFPLAVLEAMASKVPIVATNVGGIPELIDDSINGFLCNPNPNEISKKIIRLLEDQQLRFKFANTSFNIVQNKFSWDRVVKEYIGLYEGLVSYKK